MPIKSDKLIRVVRKYEIESRTCDGNPCVFNKTYGSRGPGVVLEFKTDHETTFQESLCDDCFEALKLEAA